jgi:predicted esterase
VVTYNLMKWLGNSRGNKYSRSNSRYDTSHSKFWDFSFHDIGVYDIPASLNYILQQTGHKKLVFIGYSQGCASLLAGLCERFDYFKDILAVSIFLAPVSKIENADSAFLQLLFNNLDEDNSKGEIFPDNHFMSTINNKFAKYYPILNHAVIELVSDEISLINCPERLKIYLAHYPSGTSMKSLKHFKQISEAKIFQAYDYLDPNDNEMRYGTKTPKTYNLANIEGLNFIICGGKMDKLVNIDDVKWLYEQLRDKNNISFYQFEYMGHLSFLLSNDITWFNFVLIDLYKYLNN